MSENMEHPEMEDGMEEDVIVFEGEDGEEYSFQVEDYFFYQGEEYAVLSEITKEEDEDSDRLECIVCRIDTSVDENGEEIEEFVNIEDPELAEKLIEIANTRITEENEEE